MHRAHIHLISGCGLLDNGSVFLEFGENFLERLPIVRGLREIGDPHPLDIVPRRQHAKPVHIGVVFVRTCYDKESDSLNLAAPEIPQDVLGSAFQVAIEDYAVPISQFKDLEAALAYVDYAESVLLFLIVHGFRQTSSPLRFFYIRVSSFTVSHTKMYTRIGLNRTYLHLEYLPIWARRQST